MFGAGDCLGDRWLALPEPLEAIMGGTDGTFRPGALPLLDVVDFPLGGRSCVDLADGVVRMGVLRLAAGTGACDLPSGDGGRWEGSGKGGGCATYPGGG